MTDTEIINWMEARRALIQWVGARCRVWTTAWWIGPWGNDIRDAARKAVRQEERETELENAIRAEDAAKAP